jgi:nucleotide-binding universal stress UspA family protein
MKMLVTVDGSRESEAIVPAAVGIAKAAGLSVTLLTVCAPEQGVYPRPDHASAAVSTTSWFDPGHEAVASHLPEAPAPIESHGQALAREQNEAADYLAGLAERFRADGVEATVKVLLSNEVEESITQFAASEGFDLVAMSTHGRSGLNELIHGTVAGAVLRAGIAPVILVRPPAS